MCPRFSREDPYMKYRNRQTSAAQYMIHLYRKDTGLTAVDMREVAKFALRKGWPRPKPLTAEERVARDFARAARAEEQYDEVTKRPYRVNHAYVGVRDGVQMMLWDRMDAIQRGAMRASLGMRRQQMVDDGYHISCDTERWNATHVKEEPLNLSFNLTNDIEERKNAADIDDEKAG